MTDNTSGKKNMIGSIFWEKHNWKQIMWEKHDWQHFLRKNIIGSKFWGENMSGGTFCKTIIIDSNLCGKKHDW
jgi:hypothetical protein